jgi:hypothetical protein
MSEWELFNASHTDRTSDPGDIPGSRVVRDDVCQGCGSENFWYDSQSEAYYCESCNTMVRKEHATGGNWESLGEETGSHNSCGSQFLGETCSRVYVAGNRALSRLELHSSSNNHETSTIRTWEAINKKASRLPAHYREKIKTLYALYYRDHLNRDKVKWGIIAAFARYTCLLNGTPYTDSDLAGMFGVTTRKLRSGIGRIEDFLYRNETTEDMERAQECESSPEYLIITYGKMVMDNRDEIVRRMRDDPEVPPERIPADSRQIMALCQSIISKADKYKELASATPQVMAASVMYTVFCRQPAGTDDPATQAISSQTIGSLFGVSAASINTYSGFMLRNYGRLIS